MVLAYNCTYASAPSPAAYTNTATATWDKTAASTATGSAHGKASGAFGAPTSTLNETVTITDSFAGTLGTVTGVDASPFTTKPFTYPRTLTAPATDCTTVNNTATIVETGQTASRSVQNCATTPTGTPSTPPGNPSTPPGGSTSPSGNPAISIVKSPKSSVDRVRCHGQLLDHRDEQRQRDALQRHRRRTLFRRTATRRARPSGAGLDGSRSDRQLQLLAAERDGALHERRGRDRHAAERGQRDRERLGAGHGDAAPAAAGQARGDSCGDLDRQGPELPDDRLGGTATFTITVKNTGDVTLTDVTVTDLRSPACNRTLGTLTVGQSKSYTCTQKNVTKAFQNVATATGKPPTSATVKASDHANVKVALHPAAEPADRDRQEPEDPDADCEGHHERGRERPHEDDGGLPDRTLHDQGDEHGERRAPRRQGRRPVVGRLRQEPRELAGRSIEDLLVRSQHRLAELHERRDRLGPLAQGHQGHRTDHAKVVVTVKTTSESGAQFQRLTLERK